MDLGFGVLGLYLFRVLGFESFLFLVVQGLSFVFPGLGFRVSVFRV